jgi:2',3'-cyclic-nucleotide 2'-phosphodiesterase (5'-nucleotidase family)
MKARRFLSIWLLALLLVACTPTPMGPDPEPEDVRQLVILYTSDEHGWIEADGETGGAAELLGLWREKEGYTRDGPYLILSGGDMWTGPAVSTWFDGAPMVEVMNAIGYDAAVVGNHEFDFGLDGLRARSAQATFPFLSANIKGKSGGQASIVEDDTIKPYIIVAVDGIQVGVIGLTTRSTPRTTMPSHVASFAFVPYRDALKEAATQAKADGAQVLVVVGHICEDEMVSLTSTAAELGVAMIGGGHCHQEVSKVVDGVALVEGGAFLNAYAKVVLSYDPGADRVVSVEPSVHDNAGGTPDAEVAAIVSKWRTQADEVLADVIGYSTSEIRQRSNAMLNMVTDAWLFAYPSADVALSNQGGFRQSIPAGEITVADIVGVLPFNNVLIDVELTGAQLIDSITCCDPAIGGMTTVGGYALADGTPIEPEAVYHVLVNDFMYAGGDRFRFGEYDPDAYNTAIDWRQPVIDWILSLQTSAARPLDSFLDTEPR